VQRPSELPLGGCDFPKATCDFLFNLCTMPHRQLSRQPQNFSCLNSSFSHGVHHGRSHPVSAARELKSSSASFAPNSAIPRSSVCCERGTLGKKHRGMEFLLADGLREGDGQNGLGLYDLILRARGRSSNAAA
jgi:hypothetical protein